MLRIASYCYINFIKKIFTNRTVSRNIICYKNAICIAYFP